MKFTEHLYNVLQCFGVETIMMTYVAKYNRR